MATDYKYSGTGTDYSQVAKQNNTQVNYLLPDDTIIYAGLNPAQAPTVNLADYLQGRVGTYVPPEIANYAKTLLGNNTTTYNALTSVQNAGAVPVPQSAMQNANPLQAPLPGQVNPNAAFQNNVQPPNPAQTGQQAFQQSQQAIPMGDGTAGGYVAQTPSQTQQNAPGGMQTGGIDPATGQPFTPQQMSALDSLKMDLLQAQNTLTQAGATPNELSDKYNAMYESLKGTTTPTNGSDAMSAMGETKPNETNTTVNQDFNAGYGALNTAEKAQYDTITTALSTPTTQQGLAQEYAAYMANTALPAGIPGESLSQEQLKAMDITRMMEGTRDDIAKEIEKAGGFATNSQVEALTAARNKVLQGQLNTLMDSMALKQDYIDHLMNFTEKDRAQVEKDLDKKLGLQQMQVDLLDKAENAARDNIQNVVDTVGWAGLDASIKTPEQRSRVESLMGLGPGELQSLALYKKPQTPEEQLKLENLKLQNQKLKFDLNTGPSISTQVVDVQGRKVLINSKTGQIISEIGGGAQQNQRQMAQTLSNVEAVGSLLNDPNLGSAVGPNPAARFSFTNLITGGKSNFIAGVEQMSKQLTLDSLINAKAAGATFGALSNEELSLLSNSATKLSTWALKDSAGNITGYKASEADFKGELDKINNFAKLDFILKGGSPDAVGVQEMADGTLWVKNSNGTFTQIK